MSDFNFSVPANNDVYRQYNVSNPRWLTKSRDYNPPPGYRREQDNITERDVMKLLREGKTETVDALIAQLKSDNKLVEADKVELIKKEFTEAGKEGRIILMYGEE
ncbi:hypothetical protein NO2_0594 [Candidatus Termititenax persephonae]|uniref:Uncharacterized protein n=1 Tax=Candidatus Termititenax persephonae TaxID=2218525 RepID=A0A388TFZ6_9BACT|nr:hypothetical protein NO2_0594 [Candidatus Termititenax persephonae]